MALSILFATPWCLLDTTNGAAIRMRALLQQLSLNGHRCEVVSAPMGTWALGPSLKELLARHSLPLGPARAGWMKVADAGLVHHLSTRAPRMADAADVQAVTRSQADFVRHVDAYLKSEQPDVVFTWAGGGLEELVGAAAHLRGIPFVHNLVTTTQMPRPEFVHAADGIFVLSRFLADIVEQRWGRRPFIIRPVVNPERCVAQRHAPKFVTLMNPVPEKGFTLLLRLAEQALVKLPTARFLCVEGRWTRAMAEKNYGFDAAAFPNLSWMENRVHVREIFAKTRVLLFPSFWQEVYGMGVAEAHLNGVPTLVSRRGGIPEAGAGVSRLLPVPPRCMLNHALVPTAREVRPWLDALAPLVTSDTHWRRASRRALGAGNPCSAALGAQRVEEALGEMLDGIAARKRRRRGAA